MEDAYLPSICISYPPVYIDMDAERIANVEIGIRYCMNG